MKDPFFLPPLPWLANWIQPYADRLALPTLPLHIHEVLAAALLYSVIYYPVSPLVSNLLARPYYARLSRKKQRNWDAHFVSMVQSILINALALWVMIFDDDRKQMNWEERIWGYTGATSCVQSMAAGYFLWDLVVTSLNLDVFGPGTLAHAAAALLVYLLGFVSLQDVPQSRNNLLTEPWQRPFVNYYGCIFILWELSTPFLNIHWFLDKLNMTGTRVQLYNGLLLLFSFFSCRLVYGIYQSYRVFKDIWAAVNFQITPDHRVSPLLEFTDERSTVPLWLAALYLASNLTLNGLNLYWFFMMTRAVRKRFVTAPKSAKHDEKPTVDEHITEVGVDLSQDASGFTASDTLSSSRRRRV